MWLKNQNVNRKNDANNSLVITSKFLIFIGKLKKNCISNIFGKCCVVFWEINFGVKSLEDKKVMDS